MSVRTLSARITCKALPVAGLLLGVTLTATACDPGTFVVSSGGRSATIAPGSSASSSPSASAASRQPATPAAPATPTPTATATDTPTPTPTGTDQATATDVSTCLPPALTEDYLRALATQQQDRINLANCLQIPDGNQGEFTTQLALYALTALNAGEFRTDDGRHAWAGSGGDVQLPDGRTVRSLPQIAGQYS